LDFGIGDTLTTGPEDIEYPTILETLPHPRVRAYPREASVAEKFQAMVSLDTQNSRMKDFHDLWALSGALAFDAPALGRAIAACFARRGTPLTAEAPHCLTPAFYQGPGLMSRWKSYLASSAVLVRPPAQFEAIDERISGFIGPLCRRIVDGLAPSGTWPPGGPWR
jgi:hypothetical protein